MISRLYVLPGLYLGQLSLEHGIQLTEKDGSGNFAAVPLIKCLEQCLTTMIQ